MAYKFVCTSCNSEITSNYLKPGEEAFCFKCGSHMKVPLDAEEVAFVKDLNRIGQPIGQPDVAPAVVGKFSGVRAWNPRWFEGMSVPFGFLVPGILWAMNFERFGRHERKLPAMVGVIMLSIAAAATFGFVVSIPRYLAIVVNYGLGLYLYHSQKKHFKEFIEQGGRKASFRVPLGISLGLTILAVIGFLKLEKFAKEHAQEIKNYEHVDEIITNHNEYRRWEQLREAKSIDAALEIARKLHSDGKLPPSLSSYALATSLWDVHKPDSAVIVLNDYLEENVFDSGTYWYREIITAHGEYDAGRYDQTLEHLTPYIVNHADNVAAWKFRALVLKRIELQKYDPVRCANLSDESLRASELSVYSDSLEYSREAILRQVLDPARPKERSELLNALCAEFPYYNVSIIGRAYTLSNSGFQDSALHIMDRYLEDFGQDTYMRRHRDKLAAKMQADGL